MIIHGGVIELKKQIVKTATGLMLTGALLTGVVPVPGIVPYAQAATVTADSIYIAPIDRASFLAGSKFDFRVEIRDSKPSAISITVNGQAAETFFGKSFVKTNATDKSAEYTIRDVSIDAPGTYTVKVVADGKERSVAYEVYVADMYGKKAKNVIFFNGDGMGHPVVTAARILSKGNTEGTYNGMLEMDGLEARAVVTTSGIDSIATDSANSASAYSTGHKGEVNALGVYPDNTDDSLDNPRVETIIEMVKRATGKSTGIVSTAEIEDASPAAGVAHTRLRGDKAAIAEMFHEVQPEVILGGGSAYFLPQSVPGSKRKDDKDLFSMFEQDGYKVVENQTQLLDVSGDDTDKLLGLFHLSDMSVYYDRSTNNKAVLKDFDDQPTLWEMTETAIDVLDNNEEGFFLMVEGGSVDKQLHPLDWERAVLDAIELDKAVGVAKDFAEKHGDTLIVVTADHAHSMSITGTYWEGDGKTGKDAVRTYQNAKFPTYVDANGDGFPDELDVERKLAVHFANHPDYYEDYKMDPVPTAPALKNEEGVYVANPGKLSDPEDPNKDRFLQVGPLNSSTGVHTVEDIPLMAGGTGASFFKGTLDNTDVFKAIADAMGLQLTDNKQSISGLIQLRQFIESLDGTIKTNDVTNQVSIALGAGNVTLNYQTGSVTVNGASVETEMTVVGGRTYITKEFAAKLLELIK
ncbi:alkaline phosphatase [Paenibacillus sp. TRM 82003]|nr:alkaline phosphatase [Paenibacillus sp. TRM 82003]